MIAKVQNYYTSLNMPYIYITKRRILGESFCVAQMVPFLTHYFLRIQRLTPFIFPILVFSYSLRQIFLPIARNTWSGLHH